MGVLSYLRANERWVPMNLFDNWSEIIASAPLRSVQAVVKFEGADESGARTLCVELRRALQKKIPCYEVSKTSWWRGGTIHEIHSDEPIPPPKGNPQPEPKTSYTPKIDPSSKPSSGPSNN